MNSWSSNLWKIKKITNYYFCKCISKLAKITQKEHLLATRNFGTSDLRHFCVLAQVGKCKLFRTRRKTQTFQESWLAPFLGVANKLFGECLTFVLTEYKTMSTMRNHVLLLQSLYKNINRRVFITMHELFLSGKPLKISLKYILQVHEKQIKM